MKIGARNPRHQGIDFVIADVIAPAAVGGNGAGAEPDDADAHGPVLLLFADGDADAGVGAVIGCGQVAARGVEELFAVTDGAVGKLASGIQIAGGAGVGDFQGAVKVADLKHGVFGRFIDLHAHEDGQRYRCYQPPQWGAGCVQLWNQLDGGVLLYYDDDQRRAGHHAQR